MSYLNRRGIEGETTLFNLQKEKWIDVRSDKILIHPQRVMDARALNLWKIKENINKPTQRY